MKMKRLKSLYCILLVVGYILAALPAFAAEKTIGVVMTGGIPYYKELHKAFTEGLAAEGFGPTRAEVVLQTPTP
jgi:hypothetical protein